jgi:hypothetical protein
MAALGELLFSPDGVVVYSIVTVDNKHGMPPSLPNKAIILPTSMNVFNIRELNLKKELWRLFGTSEPAFQEVTK